MQLHTPVDDAELEDGPGEARDGGQEVGDVDVLDARVLEKLGAEGGEAVDPGELLGELEEARDAHAPAQQPPTSAKTSCAGGTQLHCKDGPGHQTERRPGQPPPHQAPRLSAREPPSGWAPPSGRRRLRGGRSGSHIAFNDLPHGTSKVAGNFLPRQVECSSNALGGGPFFPHG